MKSIIKKYILPTVLAAGMFTACTSNFEEINNDPNRPTNENLLADGNLVNGFFPQLSRSIYFNFDNSNWKWQVQQNLNGDIFSGYMAPPTPFAGNSNASHYNLIWNYWPWSLGYENVMSPANAIDLISADLTPRLYSPALVLKVLGMHRMTDIYGPIPYVDYGTTEVTYDKQAAIYDKFFAELDLAISNLDQSTEVIPTFSAVDDLYQGDLGMWKKLAASLKLRLAMRISNIDPANAKKYAEEAIASGVFEGADIAQVGAGVSPIVHPLATISEGWGDIKMGADMESILTGLNDPRQAVYFTEASGPEDGNVIKTGFAGVRAGIDLPEGRGDYQYYSRINPSFINQTTPIVLMTSAEVYFLRAEAALKGWNAGGSAQALYEEGVKQSFAQHGLKDVDTYLMDATSVPADYVDPSDGTYNTDYSTAAVSDVTIKYDASKAMEQIITQKWIAMFPEGMEAWSEFRRTGYPHIFPVKFNKSNGGVPDGEYIKRLGYPDGEAVNNVEAYNAGVANLKSENSRATGDNGGSPLWWDVD
ncbi:SusD/RagB family nutrient-binding outer membrane lipoprotein [Flammeovirga pectinis]|uniref:SusD/RagB family nutrient-binding outer membrane lipoprotein n=1 Tax=Flammeovirga pectinis TaxID=2494373 RepID=A0A3Q9FSS5_9BACT|nr:RagB/SusD family nutrient uptake outer membrane protein [Flammeovirga pectinis]AZQ63655.1 SusD/RagB family nutrient-binding outer membrane lipoprotein [Flammeovirga pectinis]